MTRRNTYDLALLAPVPLEHLESAEELTEAVLFGSDKYELFENKEIPTGIPVYIYASHTGLRPEPIVSWQGAFGVYYRAEEVPPSKRVLRPASTHTDTAFVGYFEVQDLRQLDADERFRISDLAKLDGKPLSDVFIPEGPFLVRI